MLCSPSVVTYAVQLALEIGLREPAAAADHLSLAKQDTETIGARRPALDSQRHSISELHIPLCRCLPLPPTCTFQFPHF